MAIGAALQFRGEHSFGGAAGWSVVPWGGIEREVQRGGNGTKAILANRLPVRGRAARIVKVAPAGRVR